MKYSFAKTTIILATAATLIANVAAAQITNRLQLRKASEPTLGLSAGPSNGTARPDLIILPRYSGNSHLPGSGFCGPWNAGNQKVYFYVKNIGAVVAPASDVQVNFGGRNYSTVSVPALAPGQSTLRNKTIPASAWGPSQYHTSVQFLIAADHNDAMLETSETNNYGESNCMGPAT